MTSSLRGIVRLGLPAPWVMPTMLDIVKSSVRFEACMEMSLDTFADASTKAPSMLARAAVGYLVPQRPGWGRLHVPPTSIGQCRVGFWRPPSMADFTSAERGRLDTATPLLAAVLAAKEQRVPQDCPLLDGWCAFLAVGADMRVLSISHETAILRRCALHFGITRAARPTETAMPLDIAQELWDAIRFNSLEQGQPSNICGHSGAFQLRVTSMDASGVQSSAMPKLIVQVTQRIPRALQAISTFTQLRLSPREVEACRWIVEGLQRPEIAERMHVAESTVRSSIKSVYARLGIGSREQLVSLALRAFSAKAQAS
jgi:DNA-binding CsgD family transcriptional regulator